MIKIIHTADLHLDSPLTALTGASSAERRRELCATFTSLTMSVKMNKADFLLIAGDLFDSLFVSPDTIALLCREFASIPDCKIIIAPGNHDPYTKASYYRSYDFPENVYIFSSPELTYFDFPESNVKIYGWAFDKEIMESCPLGDFTVEDKSCINILLAHGELDGDGVYCNIPKRQLAACGFDYVALGHRHTHKGFEKIGNGYVSYSGCLEGRGFDETGEKGALLILIDKKPVLDFSGKLVPFAKRKYIIDSIDVSGAKSNSDIVEMVSRFIEQKHYDENIALRLRLSGNVSSEFKLSEAYLREQFTRLYIFDPIDDTVPDKDSSSLRDAPTIKGEFYRELEHLLNSPDKDEREIAAMALRYGMAAMNGEEIIDFSSK